ncbi:hypothetical protein [Winogradskyella immobilis]|uniref:Pyrroloquinoline-quinone binding quinoprotein n=1 Tax=Winogradskyella immobilis TaxID=2816852 RepID=A0ABS8EJH9_9FLAO|nr:hypothetical protein [Winogradskyella immobilis]MCC1483340.1 hypothetical protein [Winogradskyella immobilis]MCG0015434.1 hypothetical protein [Winogradskyella immobilis]
MRKYIFYILITKIVFVSNAQVNEVWNFNVETYIHNTSYYHEKNLPIEIIKFNDQTYIILTQDKSLIKMNLSGDIIWKNEISRCATQGIIKSDDESIMIICGKRLKKYNSDGGLVWEKDYTEILKDTHALINDITLGEDGIIYLVGHFWYQSSKIFISAIDIDGNIFWNEIFNQRNIESNSVIKPKEILINNDNIFILAQERAKNGSFLYTTDLFGKNRKEVGFQFEITKIKPYNNGLKTIGNSSGLKDYLIITKFDDSLNILKHKTFKLPRNMVYEKATRFYSFKISKKKFYKTHETVYTVNDFQYVNDEELIVVGNSFGDPWIIKVNENSGILWNWAKKDNRYFKFDKKYTEHRYTYSTISKTGDDYILTGIATEKDNDEWLKTYINLFFRKIKLD